MKAQQIATAIFANKSKLDTPSYPSGSLIALSKLVFTQRLELIKHSATNNTSTSQSVNSMASSKQPSINPAVSINSAIAQNDESETLEAIAIGDRFELDLEINNCDQLTRRRLTSKDTLNKISEQFETGITVRGTYCEPGKKTAERKLYLALEGKTKYLVERAYLELQKVIKDEEHKLRLAPIKGRYKILG